MLLRETRTKFRTVRSSTLFRQLQTSKCSHIVHREWTFLCAECWQCRWCGSRCTTTCPNLSRNSCMDIARVHQYSSCQPPTRRGKPRRFSTLTRQNRDQHGISRTKSSRTSSSPFQRLLPLRIWCFLFATITIDTRPGGTTLSACTSRRSHGTTRLILFSWTLMEELA